LSTVLPSQEEAQTVLQSRIGQHELLTAVLIPSLHCRLDQLESEF
jgi:hypothetical protein